MSTSENPRRRMGDKAKEAAARYLDDDYDESDEDMLVLARIIYDLMNDAYEKGLTTGATDNPEQAKAMLNFRDFLPSLKLMSNMLAIETPGKLSLAVVSTTEEGDAGRIGPMFDYEPFVADLEALVGDRTAVGGAR